MTITPKILEDGIYYDFSIDQPLQDGVTQETHGVLLYYYQQSPSFVRTENAATILSHECAASLTDEEAAFVGLPPHANLVLAINAQGAITAANSNFKWTWYKPQSNAPLLIDAEIGSFLQFGARYLRLNSHLYKILLTLHKAKLDLSKPNLTPAEKLQIWGAVKSVISSNQGEESVSSSVKEDNYLGRLIVSTADSFTIDPTGDHLFFTPRLKAIAPSQTDLLTEEVQRFDVLTSANHKLFMQSFAQTPMVLDCYALGNQGHYIFISPKLKRVLQVVKKYQAASSESEKINFLKNPRLYFSEEIGDILDDEELTVIYSERITGIGERPPIVVPWMKLPSTDWLGRDAGEVAKEIFGLRINDTVVELDRTKLDKLTRQVDEAIQSGETNIIIDDIPVSVSQMLQDDLRGLKNKLRLTTEEQRGLRDSAEQESYTPPPPQPTDQDIHTKRVLLVKSNFDGSEFERVYQSRLKNFKIDVPNSVRTQLKEHQLKGFKWLCENYCVGAPGALLADDMGLGKTLQVLSFLAWLSDLRAQNIIGSNLCLIVAPTSLLGNWHKEIERHLDAGTIRNTLNLYGKEVRKFSKKINGTYRLDVTELRNKNLILTTYETLRNYQIDLASLPIDILVFDEAQKIKHPTSEVTWAAKTLNADFCVCMTGTPIENRLADLWCIMDTAQPAALGDLKAFSKKYESSVNFEDEAVRQANRELKAFLQVENPPNPAIMLRRMKSDGLIDLPPKKEILRPAIMPQGQAAMYSQYVEKAKSDGPTDTNAEKAKGIMLEVLHHLKRISLHPEQISAGINDKFIMESARLSETMRILDEIQSRQEKVLIFVRDESYHKFFTQYLAKRYSLPFVANINGKTEPTRRQKIVDGFEDSKFPFNIFVLSPNAAGVGLTITSANNVIHLERWWNPAVEDQATDRVYRMGQTKEVKVYYPFSVHPEFNDQSFDLKLNSLIDRKRRLSREVLIPPVTVNDLTDMYSIIRSTTEILPQAAAFDWDIIDRCHGHGFEDWIADTLTQAGIYAQRTSFSHENGADILLMSKEQKPVGIIQCKHKIDHEKPLDRSGIDDLLRASPHYEVKDYRKLILISNAAQLAPAAVKFAAQLKMPIILRQQLPNLVEIISQIIS